MVLNVHGNHKAYWGREEGLGGGGRGKGVWRWGKREIEHLSLHCHHQHDFCSKMGSDESHFNVIMNCDSVHRPQLLKRKENRSGIEPRPFCLSA